ncbi:MAG: hypothetical protein GWO20_04260 [Candidatus Korarchaeota archaeon]|nr:hypothetical protein [Candidatus Korarchaeota archaeon]NIU82616.1 hypothetical protein [Candidatus Thorarchaeota archaeon]NIW13101.1 hypothetical protein [Candidatus Thorarchaeota archaeon]NIW51269.1 hypothetical protein [Candidatus Korarchaeota archaeon]
MEFLDVIRRTLRVLRKVELEFVIVGGVAVIIEGEPRTTRDVDVIVEAPSSDLKTLLQTFAEENFEVLPNSVETLRRQSRVTILDQKSSLTVDVKRANTKIDHLALANKRIYSYQDLEIPIPSPELILLGKLTYLGDITNEKRALLLKISDVTDFIAVFNRNKQELDRNWLKHEAKQRGLLHSYKRLLRLAKEADPDNYR